MFNFSFPYFNFAPLMYIDKRLFIYIRKIVRLLLLLCSLLPLIVVEIVIVFQIVFSCHF